MRTEKTSKIIHFIEIEIQKLVIGFHNYSHSAYYDEDTEYFVAELSIKGIDSEKLELMKSTFIKKFLDRYPNELIAFVDEDSDENDKIALYSNLIYIS